MNVFAAVKEAVPVEDYARTLTELRPSGLRLVGRCPIPDHDDRTPSFTIWPESGSWWCFGCSRGVDVIHLFRFVEGGEPWEAMMTLAMRYGVELPEKSDKWFRWQEQKAEIRDFNERIRHERRLRRWFRIFHRDDLAAIADPEERRIETERCWRELRRWTPRPDWWGAA